MAPHLITFLKFYMTLPIKVCDTETFLNYDPEKANLVQPRYDKDKVIFFFLSDIKLLTILKDNETMRVYSSLPQKNSGKRK